MKRLYRLGAGIVALSACVNTFANEEASCRTQRIGVIGWTDVVATSAVAGQLLKGLGYQTKESTASQQIIFAGIEKGQVDFLLGYWSPAMDDNIKPFVERGGVKVLAQPNLADGVINLAVPRYTAQQGLKTFADIAKFKDQLGGKIHGIEAGSGSNAAIQKMIDSNQFDLGDFKLIESSEAAMLAEVGRAIRQEKPVVFLGWKPHPMNIHYELSYLTQSEGAMGPNDGMATVSTVTAPGLAERCPNVAKLLENLVFTSDQEGELMEPIMNREKPDVVARTWLSKHPQVLEQWLADVRTADGHDGLAAVKAYLQ